MLPRMSVRMQDVVSGVLGELRYEPTAKRIRARLGGEVVVDSTRAVLLWEPRRVVATWAVPVEDVRGELTPGAPAAPVGDDVGLPLPDVHERPVLTPDNPFAVHTAPGEPLDLVAAGQPRPGAAFRLADPQLAGYVALDFAAFDSWLEEDEPNVSHPRETFHRIDVLASSRHLRLERDGELLAESSRPTLLFETLLPVRFYLPADDVRVPLEPSSTRSWCAYKGHASYLSPVLGGGPVPDLAWTYPEPLREAAPVRDLVCFFDERVDVVLDGERRARPVTPWS
jgi:uncharacterized protein (DUF427 family)